MKRAICLLLMLVMLSAALSAAAQGEAIGRMEIVNCEEWVSFRAKPDVNAKRLEKIPLGATVENCTAANDRFIYAEYNGRGGYILSEYLQPAKAEKMFLGDLTVTNCTDYVNMRAQPDTNAKRVARVPVNAVLKGCTAAENGFVFGRYNDVEGYVSAAYLGSAEGVSASNRLTDCRVLMVSRECACGAVLLSQDMGGNGSLKRDKSLLDTVLGSLPQKWQDMVRSVPEENIVEIAGGRELYLIIPADEAAGISINELTPPKNGEPAKFERVVYRSANGKPFLLRCNAAEPDAAGNIPYDCEVNLVDSRGNGMTWYPYMDAAGNGMNTESYGLSVMDLTMHFAE